MVYREAVRTPGNQFTTQGEDDFFRGAQFAQVSLAHATLALFCDMRLVDLDNLLKVLDESARLEIL